MSKLILSDELRAQVNGDDAPSEVCDVSGNLIGYFVSPKRFAQYQKAIEECEEAHLDELDRISQEEGGYTLKEIWKELGVE